MITPARLRQARELRGLTQTALARQVRGAPLGDRAARDGAHPAEP